MERLFERNVGIWPTTLRERRFSESSRHVGHPHVTSQSQYLDECVTERLPTTRQLGIRTLRSSP